MSKENKNSLSRRKFLRGAGASVAGLAVVGSAGLLMKNSAIATQSPTPGALPYIKIDPDKAAERAYQAYFKGNCGSGAAAGIIGCLADEIGSPYDVIPISMFIAFGGGGNGWGNTCGALIGPMGIISGVVTDKKVRSEMLDELLSWYTQFPFPEYQPAGLNLPKVVVGSTICHVSVTRWCNAEGACVKTSSQEKKERCAGVVADVTNKTVQMMNAYADSGIFAPSRSHKPDPIVATCMGCHADNPPFTSAKENCMNCHGTTLINIEECSPHQGLF
jgi:hypothetical protein